MANATVNGTNGTTNPSTTIRISKDLSIQGFIRSSTSIANFLGIKYASIPARFRQAQPIDLESLTGTINATEYGPRCPQPDDPPRERRKHLFEGIRASKTYPKVEFECLSLNVYTPPDLRSTDRKLPVFVWIHGGGWTIGDGASEYGMYDPESLKIC
jgi:carboxylesterase type B